MARKRTASKKQPTRPSRKRLKPKTPNQSDYIINISESDVTFCSGPAGSGKTAVSVGLACEYILQDKVEKIVITRPVVESGRGIGFLPGTLTEKVHPYMVPIIEEMKLFLGVDTYNSLDNLEGVGICMLNESDIVRNDIIAKILRRLK